jgi:hypothetical protein
MGVSCAIQIPSQAIAKNAIQRPPTFRVGSAKTAVVWVVVMLSSLRYLHEYPARVPYLAMATPSSSESSPFTRHPFTGVWLWSSPKVLAFVAEAPEGDLGRMNFEPRGVRGGQARRRPNDAIDVFDATAALAHQVVVVVIDTPLVPRRGPGRLDAAHQARGVERIEHTVNRLHGSAGKRGSNRIEDLVGVGVTPGLQREKDSETLCGHSKTRAVQECTEVVGHRFLRQCDGH